MKYDLLNIIIGSGIILFIVWSLFLVLNYVFLRRILGPQKNIFLKVLIASLISALLWTIVNFLILALWIGAAWAVGLFSGMITFLISIAILAIIFKVKVAKLITPSVLAALVINSYWLTLVNLI